MFSNIWVEATRATSRPLSKPKMSRSPISSALSTRVRLGKNFQSRTSSAEEVPRHEFLSVFSRQHERAFMPLLFTVLLVPNIPANAYASRA